MLYIAPLDFHPHFVRSLTFAFVSSFPPLRYPLPLSAAPTICLPSLKIKFDTMRSLKFTIILPFLAVPLPSLCLTMHDRPSHARARAHSHEYKPRGTAYKLVNRYQGLSFLEYVSGFQLHLFPMLIFLPVASISILEPTRRMAPYSSSAVPMPFHPALLMFNRTTLQFSLLTLQPSSP
jgi:hypothetical protein